MKPMKLYFVEPYVSFSCVVCLLKYVHLKLNDCSSFYCLIINENKALIKVSFGSNMYLKY